MEDNVGVAAPKEKVSVAATKEKVTNAAAKGGKAFMSLVHKAKLPPEDPKPTGALSEVSPTGSLVAEDMDDDSDETIGNSPKTSMERKAKLVSRLKRGLKVGKKSSNAERSELLDGNPDDQSPRIRSADSIKAAYGHKPSTDPTSIAAMNREKLIERQEKLQAMNKQSEEMVEGAGDFASIAEELAKKIENKPWYKL